MTRGPWGSGSFGGRRIAWVHLSGFSCTAVLPDCPIHLVVCGDHGLEHQAIAARHRLAFLSLERRTRIRSRSHETGVDVLISALQERLRELVGRSDGEAWQIVCPFSSAASASLAVALGVPFHAPDVALNQTLSDKKTLHAALCELDLPRARGRWVRLEAHRWAELADELGARLVLQLATGSAGSGTRVVGGERAFIHVGQEFRGRDVWVAPYLGDLSLNINAIALADGTVVSAPSVQLVGSAALGAEPGEYCGNDFAAATTLARGIVDDVVEQTERLGGWLSRGGFRGMFGIDFVIDEASGRPVAVDLNPRWQGSTVLLSHAQQADGRRSLAVEEVALRLDCIDDQEVLRGRDTHLGPVAAGQVTLRNPRACGPVVVRGALSPGIWSAATKITRLRGGLRLGDCREPGEVLLTGGVPEPGTVVERGAFLLRLYARGAVIDARTGRLQAWVNRLVTHVEEVLDLVPVEEGSATS